MKSGLNKFFSAMRDLIINIFDGCKPTRPNNKQIGFAIGVPRLKGNMAEVNLTNEQEVDATLNITTEAGKPASVDGAPTWEVISGNAVVKPAEDGLSAVVVSSDDPGDTEILVKADADLGEGVTEISDVLRVHVTGAQAKSLGLSVGTPRPKTPAP